jgi:ribosome-associated toxin RatA of RatAB toxin-antitoxin module
MAAEHAIEQTIIDAPPLRCYEVVLDFERYPEWAHGLKEVEVLARDEEGRGLEVHFRAAAMGHSTSYTLRYDYSEAPGRLSWKLVDGDICRKLDGYYRFSDLDRGARTEVHYLLEAELVVPLPAFIKRRTELRIVHTALGELKSRVERSRADPERA